MPKKALASLALILMALPAGATCFQDGTNPVFSPPGGAAWPSVLQDPAQFAGDGPVARWKAWYVRDEGGEPVLAHAVSDDGRAWTELSGDLGLPSGTTAPRVLHDPGRFGEGPSGPAYKMWASDRNATPASIRLFESEDGLSWTDRGIVLDGTAEFDNMFDLSVAYRPAAGGANPVDSLYLGFASKGPSVTFFSSPDGVSWTQRQVLTIEATHPAPLVLPDGTVRLWAEATEFSDAAANGSRIDQYLLLPRPDGSGYDFDNVDPGLSGLGGLGSTGTWNESGVGAPAVVFDGTGVTLFRSGTSSVGSVSLGVSAEPGWTFGDTWEPAFGARSPEVLTDDASFDGFGPTARYKLWSSNEAGNAIAHAASADGDKWTLVSASVTGLAASATSIEIVHDPAGFGGGPVTQAYRAIYRDASSADPATAFRTAVSLDGLSWSDDAPIAQVPGTLFGGGAWNAIPGEPVELIHRPEAPGVLDTVDPLNNRFVMFYSASDGVTTRWGLAASADGTTWQGWQDGAQPVLGPGTGASWDAAGLGDGSVVLRPDGRLDLWYSDASGQGIGFATSTDAMSWSRCAGSPLLGLGGCGPHGGLTCSGFGSTGQGSPTVVLEEVPDAGCIALSRYRLWRSGSDGGPVSAVLSASAPADFSTIGEVWRVPEDFPTIQSAIDAAGAGDTILVAAGTYEENLVIDRSLRITGENRETTIIRSADSGLDPSAVVWVRGTPGSATDCVRLEGFTIDGRLGDPVRQVHAGVRVGDLDLASAADEISWFPRNSSITLRDLRIRDTRFRGVQVQGSLAPRIEGCVIGGVGDLFLPQQEAFIGIEVLSSKNPVISGNAVSFGGDSTGRTDVGGIRMDPVGTMTWESFSVVNNMLTGHSRGGGLVIEGDADTDPAHHGPDSHLIAGNLIDAAGDGDLGLVLRGGVYGVTVRGNEVRGHAANVFLSRSGTPSWPVVLEDNLIEGIHLLPGDHGIWLDDEAMDGSDEVHLVLTGNTIQRHSGSGLFAVNKNAASTVVMGDPGDPGAANLLTRNCRYNVELSRDVNNPSDLPNDLHVDARGNRWGVDCSPGVQSTVMDRYAVQSIGLGTVDLEPWFDEDLVLVDSAENCAGPFSARDLTFETNSWTEGDPIALTLGFPVAAADVEIESWIVRMPDEMGFTGFEPGMPAGEWSYTGLRQGSFQLIGLTPDQAFFDRDHNGALTGGDWLVLWRAPELQVFFGMAEGNSVEPFSLDHRVAFADGLFTNPASEGTYVLESRWTSRDGRFECDTHVQSIRCRVDVGAVVASLRVVKHPDGIRVYWPALNPAGFSCWAGYGVVGTNDLWGPAGFTDHSGLDTSGGNGDTVFTGDPPATYLLVVSVGPQGQLGPFRPGEYLP